MRTAGLLLLLASLPVQAQDFSPPPLVPADPSGPSPEVLTPPRVANPPVDSNAAAPRPQPLPSQVPGVLTPAPPLPENTAQATSAPGNPRLPRIAMSVLLGAGLGTAAAIGGGALGAVFLNPGVTSVGSVWTGSALGFVVGAPIGVLLAGALFRGNAPWYAPILGDLLGAAVGAAALGFGGPEALPAAFALPLLGSVLGFEVSSDDDAAVTPTVSVTPARGGAMVGLSGRF